MTTLKDILRDFQKEMVDYMEVVQENDAGDPTGSEELDLMLDEYIERIKDRLIG